MTTQLDTRSPAARAVGRACATNPVSIVIPCHRAVAQDGNLAGYRWGIERKRGFRSVSKRRQGCGYNGA